jgi:transposase
MLVLLPQWRQVVVWATMLIPYHSLSVIHVYYTTQDFNDGSLGWALDRLFEVGVTEIFAHDVSRALRELDIRVETVHLDSTSFSLEGDYHETQSSSSDGKAITITHGYSRDHRPDLKQAVLGMICEHQGGIPVWLSALDGNSSDSGGFPRMVEAYIAQFETGAEELPTVVADSALYSAGTLQRLEGLRACLVKVRVEPF